MSTAEIARSPLPADAEDVYGGKWIALREGEVVASADTFDELVANDVVRATDVLYRVPEAGSYFF